MDVEIKQFLPAHTPNTSYMRHVWMDVFEFASSIYLIISFFFDLASRRREHSICFCMTRNGVSNSQNEKERGGVNITSI
jgi:hypothetical protein